MMKAFTKYLLRGALTLLPLGLTIYVLYYFFSWSDRIAKQVFAPVIPAYEYIPGTGMVAGLGALFLLGLLMSSNFAQRIYAIIELPLKRIPMVNSLYNALRELANYLSPGDGHQANSVVLVSLPGQDIEMLGFVMREDMSDMPEEMQRPGRSVVYVPLSYQIGGFTLFIPTNWLTPVNLPVDTAMKNTLTGWITREDAAATPRRQDQRS